MSLTLEESRLHKAYANLETLAETGNGDLPARIKAATDRFFDLGYRDIEWFSGGTLKAANDDRAEALVAAIFKFICESNGVDPAVFAPLETV